MAYRIKAGESVETALRRVSVEQLDKALAALDEPGTDVHQAVHEVRRRSKKVRAALRLVRPAFPDFVRENRCLRDMARALSAPRDAGMLLECLDALVERYGECLERGAFDDLYARLRARRMREVVDSGLEDRLVATQRELIALRRRVTRWKLDARGVKAIRGGFRKTYARAGRAMREAVAQPAQGQMHEWRKRVKYHHQHLRLLRGAWKPVLEALRRESSELADLLGDDHDLGVLRQTLLADPALGSAVVRATVFALIDHRQAELRARASWIGHRLLIEEAETRAGWFGALWELFRRGAPAIPTPRPRKGSA